MDFLLLTWQTFGRVQHVCRVQHAQSWKVWRLEKPTIRGLGFVSYGGHVWRLPFRYIVYMHINHKPGKSWNYKYNEMWYLYKMPMLQVTLESGDCESTHHCPLLQPHRAHKDVAALFLSPRGYLQGVDGAVPDTQVLQGWVFCYNWQLLPGEKRTQKMPEW